MSVHCGSHVWSQLLVTIHEVQDSMLPGNLSLAGTSSILIVQCGPCLWQLLVDPQFLGDRRSC